MNPYNQDMVIREMLDLLRDIANSLKNTEKRLEAIERYTGEAEGYCFEEESEQ